MITLNPKTITEAAIYEWSSTFFGLGKVMFTCGNCLKYNKKQKVTAITKLYIFSGQCQWCGKLNIFKIEGTTNSYMAIV